MTSPRPFGGPWQQFLNGLDHLGGDGEIDAVLGFAAFLAGAAAICVIAIVDLGLGALALAGGAAWAFCMFWGRP